MARVFLQLPYHPFQKVVPAVLLDMEPVVGGPPLAEGLQRKMRQCCRGLPSAPPQQLLDEQLRECRDRGLHTLLETQTSAELLYSVCNTWRLVLAQAKSRDDILVDLILVLQGVKGRHAGCTDWSGLFHCGICCYHFTFTSIH